MIQKSLIKLFEYFVNRFNRIFISYPYSDS